MGVLLTALTTTLNRVSGRKPAAAIPDQDAFQRTICLERKRAERSHSLFLLMLLDVSRLALEKHGEKVVNMLIRALKLAIRETDFIGWHKDQAVLGIIFSEIPQASRGSVVSTMLLRVRGVLYGTLSFCQFNQVNISYHLFPEEWDHDVPQRPSHPSLYPDLESDDRSSNTYFVLKRCMDVIGSALLLSVLSPLFVAVALAIRLSSEGPVFFRQVRVGQYGEPFVFLKFRSMYAGNNPRIHEEYVKALIEGKADRKTVNGEGKGIYKLTKDPRITPVGAFLRRTSLDELPQFYNVLKGDMSLVGPRPAIPYEVQVYEPWHRKRLLEAKPGITGLWQVNGRSRVTFDEMVRLDVRYAMSRSLWLDLKILFQTPCAVFLGSGAC